MSPKWPDGKEMTALECLDNLHRCALCHKAEDPAGWMRHCREMRNSVEAELRIMELLRTQSTGATYKFDERENKYALTIYLESPLTKEEEKQIEDSLNFINLD